MSSFKDIFHCSDEELYQIVLENNFNQEKVEKYCGIYRIPYSHLAYRAKVYAIQNKYPSLVSFPDAELDFFYHEKFRRLVRKYQYVIIEKPIPYDELHLRDIKDIWVNIQNNILLFFESVHFDKELIEEKCLEWKIPFQETVDLIGRFIINNRRKYAKEHMEEIESNFSSLTDKKMETVSSLYEKVLNAETNEEVIEIANHSIQLLNPGLFYDYAITHYKDRYEEVVDNLRKKADAFNEYKLELRKKAMKKAYDYKKVQDIGYAKDYLSDFVDSDYENIGDYCNKNKITVNRFKKYVNLLKEENDPIYYQYKDKVDEIQKRNFLIYLDISNEILNKIQSGIIVNGEVKELDLLDYYMITSIPHDKLYKFIKANMGVDQVKLFGNFIGHYTNSTLLNERNVKILLDSKEVFGIQMDEDGKMIPNTGREITLEEKYYVLDYIKKNHIPLYDDIYRITLLRYLNHTLEEEKDDEKKLVRES